MSCDIQDFYIDMLTDDSIYHPILLIQPGRSMSTPLTTQRFIVEPANGSQAGGARNSDDILPLLVSLQNLCRKNIELLLGSAMFIDFPH